MPIKIFQLRPRPGHDKLMEYSEDNWRVGSVVDVFQSHDRILSKIPIDERFNVFYTVADVHEQRVNNNARELRRQDWLPFDIDDCDETKSTEVIEVVCGVLGVDAAKVLSMWSGHGVQVLIQLSKPITSKQYFDDNRTAYKLVCGRINEGLKEKQLSGHADQSIFSNARLLRVPGTINRKPMLPDPKKPPMPDVMAYVINQHPEVYDIDLSLFNSEDERTLPAGYMSKYPTPDEGAVLNDCLFLEYCRVNAATLSEPDWYRLAGILAVLPGGRRLFHEWSKPHAGYNPEACEAKFEQAREKSRPYKCATIGETFDGCISCKHYGKLTSPVCIRGDEYIVTEKSGFHFLSDEGKKPVPDYEGLRKYFNKRHSYITVQENGAVYSFNGKSWDSLDNLYIEGFAYEHFFPKPRVKDTREFIHAVTSELSKQRKYRWFSDSTNKMMSFQNVVLNLNDMKTSSHSQEYGFLHSLPYDYDPSAKCPQFEAFLHEILCGDVMLQTLVTEFIGYALSGDENWAQVSMILKGSGNNGKSTLLKIIRALIGNQAISSVSSEKFGDEKYLYYMAGKLLNISEETPRDGLVRSSDFKALTSGEMMTARPVFKQPIEFQPRAKLIFSCNELPVTKDVEHGFFRRILLIPFNYTIPTDKVDVTLEKRLLKELPGILNLCLQAYAIAYKRKSFTVSKAAELEKEIYITTADNIKTFIEDYLDVTNMDNDFTTRKDLYDAYSYDMKKGNQRPIARSKFMNQVQKHIPGCDGRVAKRKVNGVLERVFTGVRLTIDADGGRVPEQVYVEEIN